MSTYEDLVAKLREVFQIDRSDLDFGIYRILNARADEIGHYLDVRLRERVEEALAADASAEVEALTAKLARTVDELQVHGADPDAATAVTDPRRSIAEASARGAEQRDRVFSHLLTFFSRYYDKGDFISQRRYKGDTYAIPYSGEEVVLHWANRDQYYTKSGEAFGSYAFRLPDGRKVEFRLVAADTAKDNRKDTDTSRCYALATARAIPRTDDDGEPWEEQVTPVAEEDGTLVIRFDYLPQPKGTRQDRLTEAAVAAVLADPAVTARWADLGTRAPTAKNPHRSLLEKHLATFTQKNTADYFIHKNLGAFLNRELDFYIKNEVMNLDDVQRANAFAEIERDLRLIRTLRAIAQDLIAFLAQIEDFQKKLWLKKKFVVSADWCITLDRVPGALYPAIAANAAQWAQWHHLGMRDSAAPGTVADLAAAPFLMVDTALFDAGFRAELLKAIPDLDASLDGLLVHGDNFQALTLLGERFREQVKCVYIDPPYNTGSDFLYKDAFRNSSWLTMLDNRIQASRGMISRDGVFYVHIDDKDEDNRTSHRLMSMMEDRFGAKNYLDNLIWVKNTTHNDAKAFSHNHEYILAFAMDREIAAATYKMFRIAKPGFEGVQSLIARLNKDFPPIDVVRSALRNLYSEQAAKFKEECKVLGLPWDEETQRLDPWKGIKQYKFADYRDEKFQWVDPKDARAAGASLRVYREDNPSWPNANTLTNAHKDPTNDEYRFYKPLHPTTNLPCPAPARGWLWRKTTNPERPSTLSFEVLADRHLIHFGEDENKVPQFKRFLENVDSDVVKSVITDFTDGEKEVSHLFGARGIFPNPKPTPVAQKLIEITASSGEVVLDYFAGSGSTGHSVIKLNRLLGTSVRYMLIDIGDHFEDILHPRMQKVVYSSDWKDGKPTAPETGLSHAFKVLKIEGYEDTLNNLHLVRSDGLQALLNSFPQDGKDDYLLRYMLDMESKGSILSLKDFDHPFDYRLRIAADSAGAWQERRVDLVETFTYLLGLTVQAMDLNPAEGWASVTGTLPDGDDALILWRDVGKVAGAALAALCDRLGIAPGDDRVIYVNGDTGLHTTLEEDDGTVKRLRLRRIEPAFLDAMFDVEDV